MTDTQARMCNYAVQSLLRQYASPLVDETWHVSAERERRCCWDQNCTKPRHALGGKMRVRVYPTATTPQNIELLPQVEQILVTHLAGVVQTRITQLGAEVWFDYHHPKWPS
jgi:hypothetical protein